MAFSILGGKNGGKASCLLIHLRIVNAAPSVKAALDFSHLHVLPYNFIRFQLLLLLH